MPRAPGACLGGQVWLFPQIRAALALCPSPAAPGRGGQVWRQDPATEALHYCSVVAMTHRHGDIPERRRPHRNHHAGQVRLNSSGAGITAGGTWYARMQKHRVCSYALVHIHSPLRMCLGGPPGMAQEGSFPPVWSITARPKISLKIQAPQEKASPCTGLVLLSGPAPTTLLPFSILSPRQ